jgi:cytochrome b561
VNHELDWFTHICANASTSKRIDMTPNFLILLATAVVPFAVAMFWFHPGLFGHEKWQKIARLSDDQHHQKISPLRLVLSILFNFFIALGMYAAIVHEGAVLSLVSGDVEAAATGTAGAFLAEYGGRFSTFGHGAFHGVIIAVFLAAPIFGYAMIFERKSGKYFWVNLGYWAINMAIMGGIIAQWGGKSVLAQ